MTGPARRWILFGALAASAAAAGWVGGGQQPAPEPAAPAPRRAPSQPVATLDIERLQARAAPSKARELFSPQDWRPRMRTAPPPPPEPERAPPLPFTYLGRLVEDGRTTVLLAAAGRSVVAREGEVIEGRYRVEAIDEHALRLTYLPLEEPQSLALGGRP